MSAALPAAAGLVAATSSKQSSSGSYTFLILIAVFAAVYFLFLRPQSQRAKRQREEAGKFQVGDEVLTAGGIVGRVIDDQGERITLETSVGASFTVLRQYIVRRIEQPVAEPPEEEPAEDASEGGGGSDHGDSGDGGAHGDHDGGPDEGPVTPR